MRVPHLETASEIEPGTALLAEQRVESRGLNKLSAEEIDDTLLAKLWEQVKILHAAHIAHRDLRRNNVVVDAQGQPWIIDFGYSEAAASPRRQAQDVAELVASLAAVVGPERAAQSAMQELGKDALVRAMPLLQPLALSSVTRAQVRSKPNLLAQIREQVAIATSVELPAPEPMARFQLKTVWMLAGAAVAIHVLLPQVDELQQSIQAFRSVIWLWLVPAFLGAAANYAAAAVALMGAAPLPLAFGRTLLVQVAGSFVNVMTVAGIGGMGLLERYVERSGVKRPAAAADGATSMSASVQFHLPTLIVASAMLGMSGVDPVHLPKHWQLLVAAVALLAGVGVASLAVWPQARRKLAPVRSALDGLLEIRKSPGRAARLLTGAAGVIITQILALLACLYAFGAKVSLLKVTVVFLGGTAVSAVSPTPGQLGAFEAAMVAGLTAVGVPAGQAVAAVLTFRLFTFWLPILAGFLAFRYLRREQVV